MKDLTSQVDHGEGADGEFRARSTTLLEIIPVRCNKSIRKRKTSFRIHIYKAEVCQKASACIGLNRSVKSSIVNKRKDTELSRQSPCPEQLFHSLRMTVFTI